MVRCFIGTLMPENKKENIESVKREISSLPMKCKFVERENLHLCFSFLGEVEEDRIKNISKALESICEDFQRFETIINGIKLIPSENYVRVIALDVIDETKNLEKLMEKIKQEIGGDAKPPHLTLCRVKNIEDKKAFIQRIREIRVEDLPFTIDRVQIIKSELKKTGPLYTPIYEASLKRIL